MGGQERSSGTYKIYKALEDLASEMNRSVDGVVVEGPHDRKTLRLLGYRGPILTSSRSSPSGLAKLASKKFSRMAVLTDFDEAGEALNEKLAKLLEKEGVEVEDFHRRRFRRLLRKGGVSTVEGIYRLKLELFK